jgi:Organic solute transporter Ostalpha
MVPIYALNGWFGLLYPKSRINTLLMDSIRDCYEAYCLYNFLKYLFNYLNLETINFVANLELKPQVKHIFPLCCLPTCWKMGADFIFTCKRGVLQFVVLRPIITFISVICELSGVYGDGLFAINVAFPYIAAVNLVSQNVAMYCLVLFYKANYQELKPMRPLPKFLCIKAVVFFSFFQGFVIKIVVYFGLDYIEDKELLSSKLQDFLICVEMLLAAIAHKYSFPHKPYHIEGTRDGNCLTRLAAMLDVSDVHQDVSEQLLVRQPRNADENQHLDVQD